MPPSTLERIETLETELEEMKDALRALEDLLREKRLLGKDDRFINGRKS